MNKKRPAVNHIRKSVHMLKRLPFSWRQTPGIPGGLFYISYQTEKHIPVAGLVVVWGGVVRWRWWWNGVV
jgi:hypothetical protein